jgi:hypothetical protein
VLITKKLQPYASFSVIAGSSLDELAPGDKSQLNPLSPLTVFGTYKSEELRANRGPFENSKKLEDFEVMDQIVVSDLDALSRNWTNAKSTVPSAVAPGQPPPSMLVNRG